MRTLEEVQQEIAYRQMVPDWKLRAELENLCPHTEREYWEDASGNNGGGWNCKTCNKDL